MLKPNSYRVRGKTAFMIRITHPISGKRIKIRLGVTSQANALEICAHIELMLDAIKYQTDYPPKTLHWLSTVPDELYDRLVSAELVENRSESTVPNLQEFLDEYVSLKSLGGSRHGGWTESTLRNRNQSIKDLVRYFGADTKLDAIDAGAPEEWLAWMVKGKPDGRGLSPATASKKLKDARQFFEFARRKQYVSVNPFDDVRLPPQDNPDRLVYVPWELIESVLKKVDDPEFRLIIALARIAGFRIPSEVKQLRWCDLNFVNQSMRVRAPKKAGNAIAGQRICRLFPELIPYIDAVRPKRPDSSANVFSDLQSLSVGNLRTQFGRYIDRAKVDRWPRLFQNLRASALTDLTEKYPLPVVCKWLGNSVNVAMKHYLMLKGVDLTETVNLHTNGAFLKEAQRGR